MRLTFAQYAKHRGVSRAMVSKWRRSGILDDALIEEKGRKHPLVDADKADAILDASLDPAYRKKTGKKPGKAKPAGKTKRPKASRKAGSGKQKPEPGGNGNGNGGGPTYTESRALVEQYKAEKLRLELEATKARYVPKDAVREEIFQAVRTCRDALLNLPARTAAILAAEADENEVSKILTAEIRTAVDDMIKRLNASR